MADFLRRSQYVVFAADKIRCRRSPAKQIAGCSSGSHCAGTRRYRLDGVTCVFSDSGLDKKEGTVLKVVPILHSSAVDSGRHPACVNKRAEIDGQTLAAFPDFGRALT